jgi:tape measure domain-containing protein
MADDVTLKVGADTKGAEKAFKDLEKTVEQTGKDIQKVAKKSSTAWATFKGVLGAQALVGGLKTVSRAALDMGKSLVDAAKDMETINTELTTVTGSTETATKLLQELSDFAASTPFQLEGIAKSAKQLIAFGFETEKVTGIIKKIGDVAAGSGAQLSDVSLIYGQVAAAGKLTGERLLQFQERAIPIGPAIAKTMGIAEEAVKDTVSKGKVSLEIFEKAFASLSAEGGIFFESMIDKSNTFDGVMSTLADNISLLQAEMGKKLLPVLKEVAKELINFVQKNKKEIVGFFTGLIKSVATLVGWMDKLRKALGFDKEFNRLKANGDKIDELRTKIKNLSESVKGGKGFLDSIFGSPSEFERKKNKILEYQNELAQRLKLNAELVKQGAAGTYGDKTIKAIKETAEGVKEVNKELAKTKEIAETGILVEITQKLKSADIGEKIGKSIGDNIGKGAEGAKAFASQVGGLLATAVFGPQVGGLIAGLISFALQEPEVIKAQTAAFVEAIPAIIPGLVIGVGAMVEAILNVLAGWLSDIGDRILMPIFVEFTKIFQNTVGKVLSQFGEFITGAISKITQGIVKLIFSIANIPKYIIEGMRSIFSQFIEAVKKALGIGSGGPKIGGTLGSIAENIKGRLPKFADGAVIPSGFPNDSFGPVMVESGEEILSGSDRKSIKEDLSNLTRVVAGLAGSGDQTINVELTLDGNVLATQILNLNRDNARMAG